VGGGCGVPGIITVPWKRPATQLACHDKNRQILLLGCAGELERRLSGHDCQLSTTPGPSQKMQSTDDNWDVDRDRIARYRQGVVHGIWA
jgi:hypothetical protein